MARMVIVTTETQSNQDLIGTLRAVGGNRAAAARLLAVDRKTLYRKLKLYRIRLS